MIINHNMGAMNANRNMGINAGNANKSMEKLSSGLRINKAGDDAAGLAISEKMRGQIRGLDQAGANAQDAISLIGTAEGALSESTSILQRMRELAVQGSSDTNTVDDRDAMQKEVGQLSLELDRIGNTTEFNTKKLLNGAVSTKIQSAGTAVSGVSTTSATVDGVYDLDVTSEATKATLNSSQAMGATLGVTGKLNINNVEVSLDTDDTMKNVLDKINLVSDQTGVTAMVSETGGLKLESQEMGSGTTILATGSAPLLVATGLTATGDGITTAVSDAGTDAAGQLMTGQDFTATGNTITGKTGTSVEGLKLQLSGSETAASVSYKFATVVGTDATISINGSSAIAISSSDTIDQAITSINGQKDSTGVTATKAANGTDITFTSSALGENSAIEITTAVGGTSGGITTAGDVALTNELTNGSTGIGTTTNTDGTVRVASDGNLDFHIGANEGQQLRVDINDMRASALGGAGTADKIDKVDVSTKVGAEAGITNIDSAIKSVSQERAKLGAFSNRLEHTIANLGTSSENLTSAESRIRDVDMAKEMSTFSKNNILNQAAQAMLAQANQQPQQVLALLR
ncbi:flagellin [Clostridium sp.]|uniref:flagellin N-terminal helical domain-containing protein n=1 Tax=Clostridium sp. TaxID=1506 RepID=UPI001A44423A|nr:flagellin [Clostridium sp.]MBK5237087.1 hypothetical protein [Clostridium sp.]